MVVLLAIALLVFWGTYRLETWVMWLMWIEVLFSLPSLFSGKSLYQPVIYILTALIYTWIRQQVNQAIPASTPAVQPPTPPVTPPSMV
jgi:cobalamin biosynthesis protein CobD/CbiB